MKVRITSKTEVALDICAFELEPVDGARLTPFSAGAHIDVHLGPALVRQYSLCNDPNETHRYRIGVLRDPNSRGGSIAMHALHEGALLEISEPKNHFPLHANAKHSILLAGGIGVTPILCMAERLSRAGASFELHYCTREPQRTAFRERLAQPDFLHLARLYHDNTPADERIDLATVLSAPSANTHVYVCGPGGFIEAVLNAAKSAGWQEANVHREYFTAPAASAEARGAFQVQVASTGQVIDVGAEQSVTAALSACGIQIPTSCEQGICGSCLTRVLSGELDHRDVYLTEEERAANDQFLPCCSRSKTPLLVLDL
ncbi:vanillate O-demethylase ferredoxin subunit [Variovorax sp. HW608]|uniref:PDR/VanB family oxidoreductase n=1 Tax=Variovorax sp. HW608 TaxID=1034889 RepID=UPI00081F79A0|nr:PDR/VanB family oxidoreductase [Variovorax sp. HW608]SCK14327.1 vanillate O-demethylase ferredoxin subunit [Variovorax sp. HW608]